MLDDSLIRQLGAVRIFRHLGRDDLMKVAKIARRRPVTPHTVVFFEGNRADAFFIVLSGSLKVFQTARDGRIKILGTLGPGETFGELAMLEGQPRSASVEAITCVELLVIRRNDCRKLAAETPGILWGMLESVCARLRAQNDSELGAAFESTTLRVSKAVLKLAEKHGTKTDAGVHIPRAFGTEDVAEMAASTVERAQRVLEKLEDDGLVRVEAGDRVIPDLAAFRRALAYMGAS